MSKKEMIEQADTFRCKDELCERLLAAHRGRNARGLKRAIEIVEELEQDEIAKEQTCKDCLDYHNFLVDVGQRMEDMEAELQKDDVTYSLLRFIEEVDEMIRKDLPPLDEHPLKEVEG
jgi:hypothetical protein